MKLRQLYEEPRTAVIAFGRMNPPTIGHQKLVDKIKSLPGDHYVFLSQSQKPKTDPLAFEDKLRYAKFFFPAVSIGHPDVKTIIQALEKIYQLGYKHLIYVAGSDRVKAFEELINKYNNSPDKEGKVAYAFDNIQVVSAGERDPDADGAEGMSASKMRQAAADNDLESFKQGVPRDEVADEMFAAVRQGMGIKDTVKEDVSPENEKKFHNELDNLVHKYFGDSPDEEKMKKKMRKVKEGDLVLDQSRLRSHIISMIADKIAQTDDIDQLAEWLKLIVGKEINLRKGSNYRYVISNEDVVQAFESCKSKKKKQMEKAPPGREKQVKKLKGKFDDPGAPYAIAWAQHNKHGKPKKNENILAEQATAADAEALTTAIKTFQQAAGLKVDGVVGPNTRAKAKEMIADPNQKAAVETLQGAVKNFQTKAGIAVDGKVGPETTGAMKTAMSGGGANAPAQQSGDAQAGTDGAADATANAGASDASTPPQTADQATANAGAPQTDQQQSQQNTEPADTNTNSNVPDDGNRGGQEVDNPTNAEQPAADAEQPAADAEQPAADAEQPAAEPTVSAERYMQMNDQGPGLANFNVKQMKAKYPEPYLDIPNDDGTVTRAYGPEKNLQAFIDTDRRGKGLKLSGGATAAAPAQDAPQTDSELDADAQDNGAITPEQHKENIANFQKLVKEKDYAGALEQVEADPQLKEKMQNKKSKSGKPIYDLLVSQANKQKGTSGEEPTSGPDDGTRGEEPQTDQQGGEEPQTDQQGGEEPQTDQQGGEEPQDEKPIPPREKMYDVNGKQMSGNDISKRINDLLKKQGASESISYKSSIAQHLEEALSNAEKQELQSLINAVQSEPYFQTFLNRITDKLQAAGVQYNGGQSASTQEPTSGPDDGTRGEEPQTDQQGGDDDFQSGSSYTLDGKKVSRDEYEKTFGKDLSGRANDYKKIKQQIEGLAKQARDEKDKWTREQLDNPDSEYYQGVPTEPEDPDYPEELKAIDDKYKAKGERLQAKAEEMIKDPEVKKFIDDGGKDDFDKLLDGDDDKFDDIFKTDGEGSKTTTGTKKTSNSNSTSTRSSSSSSSVTTTGGSSKTVSQSGGGSTTRFSKRMKDGPDTEKLRQEKKEVRKKMRDFAKQWKKDNPDGDRFGAMDTPEYQALEKEYDSYRGMDGKIEQSKELLHPAGEMDSEGNIKYYGKGANKDGTWDGEQFDPNFKGKTRRSRNESAVINRLKVLAGV